MVVDIVIQTEINKKENKLYVIRERPFHPNLEVKILTGKFYAHHDFPDPDLIDPDLEQAILNKKIILPKNRFEEPLTSNMEYGWYAEPRVLGTRFDFHFPRLSSEVTRFGAKIAMEDQKMPKKPFTGVPFKV